MLDGTYDFLQHIDDMYAMEDFLDQPLCKLARLPDPETGRPRYEAILLTTMTGGSRMVSELLDVRSREESFRSLMRLEE